MEIFRYENKESIGTELDPIEDLLNIISFLRSKEFTSDFLREKHFFTDSKKIKATTKLISLQTETALGLAEQAFEGPSQISFLPLYYSTQSLAKIFILMKGMGDELEKNKRHGAAYKESEMSRKFLNENIFLYKKGTIPLFYKSLSSLEIPSSGIKVCLKDLYGNISAIAAEYNAINKSGGNMLYHNCSIIRDDAEGHFMQVNILPNTLIGDMPSAKLLSAYKGLSPLKDKSGKKVLSYRGKRVKGDFESVCQLLRKNVRQDLISNSSQPFVGWYSSIPLTGKKHAFSEELCVLLAFFHLSNVVRYNPEHLYKLMDSRYWPIMVGLRKHGYLRYLKLMWGNYNQTCFDIS